MENIKTNHSMYVNTIFSTEVQKGKSSNQFILITLHKWILNFVQTDKNLVAGNFVHT